MARIKFLVALFACGGLLASCNQNTPQPTFYTVNFETNGGSAIEPVKVQKGKKLKKPKNPTVEDAEFIMWCNEERLVTPYNFAQPVLSDMTIYAKWSNRFFSVSSGMLENLEITGNEGEPLEKIKAKENNNLCLKIKVPESFNNNADYIIPPSMNIVVNDIMLEGDKYSITIDDAATFKSATLTIYGENVTGDIIISGKAVDKSTMYAVAVITCYGLMASSSYILVNKESPCTITFTPLADYSLPSVENILIRLNNTGEWVNPTEETFNEGTVTYTYKKDTSANQGTLTINPNDQDISHIEIGTRAPEYNLLNELSWEQISNISNRNEAARYFYIGESKKVVVNNCEHIVRIIGINHDTLTSDTSKTAGLTLEFETLISNENGGYINYPTWNTWSGGNSDFATSSLNDQLNNPSTGIISALPVNLRKVIKKVNKVYVKDQAKSEYSTNLFILSKTELSGSVTGGEVWVPEEGTPYPFYDFAPTDEWVEKRYKFDANGGNQPYWTRTPAKDASVWLTKKSDSPNANFITVEVNAIQYTDIALSPAFCI